MTRRKKGIILILGVLAGIIALCGIVIFLFIVKKDEDEKFITAVPFDFSQIASVSKYRSCSGHNSGRIFNNEEPVSSLKHYIQPKNDFFGTEDAVKVFAPFDSRVIFVRDGIGERGGSLMFSPNGSAWAVSYAHVNPLPELSFLQRVQAGELVGYASTGKTHPPVPASFDIEAIYLPQLDKGTDSPFQHMTDDVLSEFAAHGVTPENIIVSREEREANPCECVAREDTDCGFETSVEDPDHVVNITNAD